MTPEQVAANARANDKFGFAPFQSQAVTCEPNEYIAAGGVVHRLLNGNAICGDKEGVGYTKRIKGITCVNCRRALKNLMSKGKAA